WDGCSVNLICLFSDTYKHTPMPTPREELLDNDDMLITIICVSGYLVAVNPYFYIIPWKSGKQLVICEEIFRWRRGVPATTRSPTIPRYPMWSPVSRLSPR